MRIELIPRPGRGEEQAVVAAVAQAGIDLDAAPTLYESPWRQAGLVEGIERDVSDPSPNDALRSEAYARSPRSTRGAMRA